jgi:hypothetical protein
VQDDRKNKRGCNDGARVSVVFYLIPKKTEKCLNGLKAFYDRTLGLLYVKTGDKESLVISTIWTRFQYFQRFWSSIASGSKVICESLKSNPGKGFRVLEVSYLLFFTVTNSGLNNSGIVGQKRSPTSRGVAGSRVGLQES